MRVLKKQVLEDLLKQFRNNRDQTMKYPNSFSHGYNVGQIEALQTLIEMIKT